MNWTRPEPQVSGIRASGLSRVRGLERSDGSLGARSRVLALAWRLGLACSLVFVNAEAWGRGRGGGGFRGGGGGGMRGGFGGGMGGMRGGFGGGGYGGAGMRGGMGAGGFSHAPSFSAPRSVGGGAGGGMRGMGGDFGRGGEFGGAGLSGGRDFGARGLEGAGGRDLGGLDRDLGRRSIEPGAGRNPFENRGLGERGAGLRDGDLGRNTLNRDANLNRFDRNTNTGNRTTNINQFNNRYTNIGDRNRAWNRPNDGWGHRPGWWYHRGWENGYWWGHHNNWWGGFWSGYGLGMLSGWGWGSTIWGWGYMPYFNPYAMAAPVVVNQPVVVNASAPVYDYAQPIDTESAPASDEVADPAVTAFDEARAMFKQGNYPQALSLVDGAIKTLPSDATLHEFRALVLFAQKNYDAAAATLYAVLSVGPGWDWTTLIGLYPSVDVYTTQLRALENYRDEHPDSAAARFVLAYHYLTEGHTEAAVGELKKVVALQPQDSVASGLLATLQAGAPTAGSNESPGAPPTPAAAASQPESGPPVTMAELAGSWTAQPAQGTSIVLGLDPKGTFEWRVTQGGKTQAFGGNATAGGDLLTLERTDAGGTLVGRVRVSGNDGFTFKLVNGPPTDQGLSFARARN